MVVYGSPQLKYRPYPVVTDEEDFISGNNSNYWLTYDGQTGEDARLYMAFACPTTIRGFRIKNTHDTQHNDFGTNKFKIFASTSGSGQWTKILSGNLPDAWNVDPVPVLQFPLAGSLTMQYIMFQIETFYGYAGGLQYFATYCKLKP